ncbi:Dynein light chain roadblock-type 2 [Clonorchis sinensis]|nr:Dynein light chain roadblock-type 2 [Clonorchis sinensis]
MSEVEEIFKRLLSHKGVMGAIIASSDGIAIRSTMDNSTTVQYCGLIQQLTAKARSAVRDLDPSNDLTFLRIRSKRHEIMVAPDRDYSLIVVQETGTD